MDPPGLLPVPNRGVVIAIDGAMSTGKTTLFRAIQSEFGDRLVYVPEAAREVAPDFGISTIDDWAPLLNDPVRLEHFFVREERWLTEQLDKPLPCLVDSSHYVIAAYRRHFGAGAPSPFDSSRYALILYCPPTFDASTDGFRFTDGRASVDRYLTQLLAATTIPQISMVAGALRLPRALTAIDDLLTRSHC